MNDIVRKSNLIVNLSKFSSNKKILSGIVLLKITQNITWIRLYIWNMINSFLTMIVCSFAYMATKESRRGVWGGEHTPNQLTKSNTKCNTHQFIRSNQSIKVWTQA